MLGPGKGHSFKVAYQTGTFKRLFQYMLKKERNRLKHFHLKAAADTKRVKTCVHILAYCIPFFILFE